MRESSRNNHPREGATPVFRDIVLTRRRRASVRDQLAAQIEMKMLGGELAPGQRLPSIRALARMLGVHPNTVSAAYQRLQKLGHVKKRHGAGVFVDPANDRTACAPLDLDALVHSALTDAIAQGHAGAAIRDAAARWLLAPPPDRIVVFDPVLEMAQLLAHELRQATGCPAEAVTVEDLESGPADRLVGGLVVTLPYQVKNLVHFLPHTAFEVLHVHMSPLVRRTIETLPSDSALLSVSSSRVLVQFTRDLVRGLRGNDVLLDAHHLVDEARWRPLLRVADAVLTDALSTPAVKAVRRSRVVELRIVMPQAIERLRLLLSLPRNPSTRLRATDRRPARARTRAAAPSDADA